MGVSRQMQSKFSSELSNFQEHLFTEHLWTTVFILSVPLRAVGSFFMVGRGGLGKNSGHYGWPTTKNEKKY